MAMTVGIVGLGAMGGGIALTLRKNGFPVIGFDLKDELMAELRPIFESKTSDEWVKLLSSIDILKAKVNTYEDLFADPQVQAIDAVRWVENDTLGRVPMGTVCGQCPPATGDRLTHSPHVGEHTRAILDQLGYGSSEIERLNNSGVVACYGA